MHSKFEYLKEQFALGLLDKPSFILQALDVHSELFKYADIIQTTDIREIRITGTGVSFRIGDEDIWLYAPGNESRVVPIEVLNFGKYEPHETRIMDLLSADARHVLDVGANIGWYTVRFAKRYPQAQIYAFEPLPLSYSFLERNVVFNDVGGNVSCYNYGLSDTSGSFEFYLVPGGGTNASLLNVSQSDKAQKVVGLTLTLDDWCANNEVHPDFIKCDVEGAELLVCRGGKQILSANRPIIFAELLRKWSKPFGYHPNDMLSFLSELGYVCFAVGETGVRYIDVINDETLETNYAFVHRESHSELIAKLENFS
ncbi:MAG: FkbM family methyltransferase [Chitinophagales bacterium]|jgi:FkbM family methyltransferase